MSQKSVLITGCSAGGIGSALVEAFHKHNVHVFASARSLQKMAHLKALPNVTLLTLDVTVPSSISTAVELVKAKKNGKLDFLINNSGVAYVMPALDTDMPTAKDMFEVNFWGVIAVTQAFAPLLIAAKGTIANVSSIASLLHVPWMSIYCASKAALTIFSETLRVEMAPFDVKVVTVITGIIETNIMSNSLAVEMPLNSRYAVARKEILGKAHGKDVRSHMKSADYAERVVGDLLNGANGKIYRGEKASVVRYSSVYLPTSIVDGLLTKGTGLDLLEMEA